MSWDITCNFYSGLASWYIITVLYVAGMPAPSGNKKKAAVPQPYIPGMNQVTDPNVIAPVLPGSTKSQEPKQVPKELVRSFVDGTKHPVRFVLLQYSATVLTGRWYLCVCVRERERETDRQTDRDRDWWIDVSISGC